MDFVIKENYELQVLGDAQKTHQRRFLIMLAVLFFEGKLGL